MNNFEKSGALPPPKPFDKVMRSVEEIDEVLEDASAKLGTRFYSYQLNPANEKKTLINESLYEISNLHVKRTTAMAKQGYCQKCEKANPSGSKFCNNCAADLFKFDREQPNEF